MIKDFNIVIANFFPEFNDGRVYRTMALLDELEKTNKFNINVFSFGFEDSVFKEGKSIFYKSSAIGLNESNLTKFKTKKSRSMHLVKSLLWPDIYILSLLKLYRDIKRNAKIDNGDIFYFSVPWFSILLLSLILNERKNKLVIDFRDLWYENKIFESNYWSRRLVLMVLLRLQKKKPLVLCTTSGAKEKLISLGFDDIILVKNSYDEKLLQHVPASNSNTVKNSISYFGNVGNKRNAIELIEVLGRSSLEICFYGNCDSEHRGILGSRFKGYLEQKEMLQLASNSEFLLLIIREDEDAQNAIPAKVYEYMLVRRPIILYCPAEAAVHRLLKVEMYPHLHIESEGKISESKILLAINEFKQQEHVFQDRVHSSRQEEMRNFLEELQ